MRGGAAALAAAALAALLVAPASAHAHGGVGVIEDRDEHYNVTLLASEHTVGDGYEVVLPEDERGEWRDWGFAVDAVGRAGHSRAGSDPVRDSYSPPGWLLPSAAVLAVACLGVATVRRGRSL